MAMRSRIPSVTRSRSGRPAKGASPSSSRRCRLPRQTHRGPSSERTSTKPTPGLRAISSTAPGKRRSIHSTPRGSARSRKYTNALGPADTRSEEHTSELQSHVNLVCRLLLEKKKNNKIFYVFHKKKKKTISK